MKNLITILASLSLTPFAHAVLGPEFPNSERPHSVCAIEYYRADDGITLDEVCSAVVIDKKHLLTAAHCLPGLPERPHKLRCRGGDEAQIIKVTPNKESDLEDMVINESARSFDNALIEIDRELSVPTLRFASSREETEQLLKNSPRCGIFGHGGFRHELRNKGISTNAKLNASDIYFIGDLMHVNGFKGAASGLVEPGDSGGSLACFDSNLSEWIHIGQTSARRMDGISLFAPSFTIAKELEGKGIISIDPLHNDIKLDWQKEDIASEEKACEIKLARLKKTAPSTPQSVAACKQEIKDLIQEKISHGEDVRLKVAPYSLISLDQRDEMIELEGGRDETRILQNPNPFSTVEGLYNRFMISRIEGDVAIGDFQRFGYSEYFGCFENILCDGGLYKNIKVKIDDLVIP